jgi:hypothetical protein
MKVLIATADTQGQRSNDFTYLIDGELVTPASLCDRDDGNPDGPCGCWRSFTGLVSGKSGTTAKVADLDMTFEDWAAIFASSAASRGFTVSTPEHMTELMLELAAAFDVGDVIERRGADDFTGREP